MLCLVHILYFYHFFTVFEIILSSTYNFRIVITFVWWIEHFVIKYLPVRVLEIPSLTYLLVVIPLTSSFSDGVFILPSFLKDNFSGYTILGCQLFQHFDGIFYDIYSIVLFLVTVADIADKEVIHNPPLPLTYTHRHSPDF